MKRKMNQLATALAGKANWTWWAGKFPVGFQLEFDTSRTTIRLSEQPVQRLAVAFYGLSSVSFVERGVAEKGWAYQLNAGKISAFEMSESACTFNAQKALEKMTKEAVRVNTVYGARPEGIAFKTANAKLGFWADNVGILVASESVKLFGVAGEIDAEKLDFSVEGG